MGNTTVFANYSGEIYLKCLIPWMYTHLEKNHYILKDNKHIFLQIKSPLFFHVAIYCSPNKKVPMRSGVARVTIPGGGVRTSAKGGRFVGGLRACSSKNFFISRVSKTLYIFVAFSGRFIDDVKPTYR